MMQSIETSQKTNLYESDYLLWIEEQVKALSEHDEKALDWDNLEEEINSLKKEQMNAFNSFLQQIIMHKLKLDYTNKKLSRNHWINELIDIGSRNSSNKISPG